MNRMEQKKTEDKEEMKKQIWNPYMPSYEYVPDGEPHIFGDRLYIYGSHDRFNGTNYCENDYVCWSAPVDDLSDWRFEGYIFRRSQHSYPDDGDYLFAPDVVQGADGRYYLYYSVSHSSRMSVAVCDEPAGKYEYLGDVRAKDGHAYGVQPGELYQFDPGVFRDDDGTLYLYSGFCPKTRQQDALGRQMPGAHVCRLEADMLTMVEEPEILIPRDFPCPEGAEFFEAPSMRKIRNTYYFIYSARCNGLHYATSDAPDGAFVYGGRIHSSSDVGLRGYTMEHAAYPNGNTHGSLIEVKGQFYIFDHRFSNNSSFCRQAVAEPVTITEDGRILQAEATSCGLNLAPLKGKGAYPAYIVCHLRNLEDRSYDFAKGCAPHMAYLTQDGEDRECGPGQYLSHIQNGTIAGYKYFAFSGSRALRITWRGKAEGTLYITTQTDQAEKQRADYEMACEIPVNLDAAEWEETETDVDFGTGVKPLYFIFEGSGMFDMKEFEIV